MVNFAILNSKSSVFKNRDELYRNFPEILKVLEYLRKKNYYSTLRTSINIDEIEIIKDKTLKGFFQEEKDRDLKMFLKSFLANKVIRIEFPISHDEDVFGLKEYKYMEEEVKDLGYADIFNTLSVSFLSDKKWDKEVIILNKSLINENGEIKKEKVEIFNASRVSHIDKNFHLGLKIREDRVDKLVKDFKNEYINIFKKIHFSEEAIKSISELEKDTLIQAMSILYQIEVGIKKLEDFSYSDESRSVKSNPKLKELRKFKIADGKEIYMFHHIKNLSNGNRIYFNKESDSEIWIGYIGKHLKTKKY